MLFRERLLQMAKSGEAFYLKAPVYSAFLVPFGKYAGLWKYNRLCKRLMYAAPSLNLFEPNVVENKDKTKTSFPLPAWIYADIRVEGDRFHPGYLHATHNDKLGWMVYHWKKFNEKHGALLDKISSSNVKQQEKDHFTEQQNKILRAQLSFFFPHLISGLNGTFGLHPETFEQLALVNLNNIGCNKKYNFLKTVLRTRSIKKALKYHFRNASAIARNTFLESLEMRTGYPWLSLLLNAKWNFSIAWHKYNGDTWKADPSVLEQLYRTPSCVKHEAQVNNETGIFEARAYVLNEREERVSTFGQYLVELRAVRLLGIEIPNWQETDLLSTTEYRRRHDFLVEEARKYRQAKFKMSNEHVEKVRQENIGKLKWVPSNFRPLVSWADFQNETNTMHHCVQNHFNYTDNQYFHVSYPWGYDVVQSGKEEEEEATLQVLPDGSCGQLFGKCNAQVSDGLRKYVEEALVKMRSDNAN